ncbi:unnamed protein product [Candidula unifasciata]|uniref:Uncharacterized protein n=1 Tax=Candidula unifasciata TaxID=100452 RepID=A0A8S3YXE9_9EUPU|nr:unnamed protein product [Candidula unifasciata]
MAKEDFDLFWTTHLSSASHSCNHPEATVLYYHTAKEETSNFPWTRKEGTSRLHATAAVARDLLTQVRVATRRNAFTATLIQNFSPCFECAEEIIKTVALAKEKRIKFEISIAFVALNRIRRPSWIWRGMEDCFHGIPVNESNDNVIGLRQLQESGVKLVTFSPNLWSFLFTFLGNGLPLESRGKFLGGKYSNAESRLEEDKLTEADLRQILKGVVITSSSTSLSSSTLEIEWTRPSLFGQKVSDYHIVSKKVAVKNKEEDARLWQIHHTVDKVGVKVTVSGELTACVLADLELDTFYDVTVEAVVKGMSVSVGRKIFRTANKVPIASLKTPTITRKATTTSSRPVTSLVATNNGSPTSDAPIRLRRSNSIQTTTGSPSPRVSCNTDNSAKRATLLRRSSVGTAFPQASPVEELDKQQKPRAEASMFSRSASLRSYSDKSATSNQDSKRKESIDAANKSTTSGIGRNSVSGGRRISTYSIASTML